MNLIHTWAFHTSEVQQQAGCQSLYHLTLGLLLLLLLSHISHVQLCATPQTVAHQAPLSLGLGHWSGLSFPSPMHEIEK